MKPDLTIVFLIISYAFMTLAWYGHLFQFKKISWVVSLGIFGVILISWGLAFFEYLFQVPANRIGYEGNGGPFSLFELKIIQEAVSLTVFAIFAIYIFKTDKLQWNYIAGFLCMMLAVFFVFKKW
jgi:uncharacterized protein (DUF486 family)